MKKIILLSLALFMVFLISAIAHLPAQIALNYLPLPQQLMVSRVTGSFWNGRADSIKWQNSNYGSLNWTLSPLKLMFGKAEAQVRFGQGSDMQISGRGTVGLSMSGPYAHKLVASIPVDKALELAPPLPIPIELNGKVELSIQSMVYAAPYCQSAIGSLVWNTDKVVTPLDELKLGPVIANFTCNNSDIKVKAEQSSRDVISSGDLELSPNRTYQASVWFKPGESFPQALAEQLKWLPSPDGQGRYQFSYQGKLN
ncbi:type II secretion system protein GspN [Vibrio sp. OCN044]|uniref:Type II secretion system protein N n=1 Tax=Vibrio tetraodonis subsp. pristinus TaxID=2695891 RepID=A0A6L8LXI5_9VIBR|nr:type II secretion system protein N [Vibrio tetraodonis]MYM60818.1 type II secretion system protein GspN [Vibrio tetraodonis subsp. pristinus]